MEWFNDIVTWVRTFPEPWPGVVLMLAAMAACCIVSIPWFIAIALERKDMWRG